MQHFFFVSRFPKGGDGNRDKGFRSLRKDYQKRSANGNQQTANEHKKAMVAQCYHGRFSMTNKLFIP